MRIAVIQVRLVVDDIVILQEIDIRDSVFLRNRVCAVCLPLCRLGRLEREIGQHHFNTALPAVLNHPPKVNLSCMARFRG